MQSLFYLLVLRLRADPAGRSIQQSSKNNMDVSTCCYDMAASKTQTTTVVHDIIELPMLPQVKSIHPSIHPSNQPAFQGIVATTAATTTYNNNNQSITLVRMIKYN